MDLSEISDYRAESGVISTLIYHPEFLAHSSSLREKHFYSKDNAVMLWAIRELYNQKITNITALNLDQVISSNAVAQNALQDYNLPSFQEYIDTCYEAKRDTIEEYRLLVRRVIELAFKREVYKKTSDWQNQCRNSKLSLNDMSGNMYKELNDLTTQFVTDGEITTFGSKVQDIWQKMKKAKETGAGMGFPSYFSVLNNFFTYDPGELVVFEARMKMGKSYLAMIEAIHKAENGVPTFMQDSEMNDEKFYIRALAYLTGIPVSHLKNDTLTPAEEQKVTEANTKLEKLPLFHNYDPYITKEKFYSILYQKKIEMGVEFVVWDYIKAPDDLIKAGERSAYMGSMANWLKNNIAGDLNVSVLAFAQLNRQMEVADSDGIERYCSVACLWNKKDDEQVVNDGAECGTHYIKVKLNRFGRQQMGDDEYIDMFFRNAKISTAKQHKEVNPYDG